MNALPDETAMYRAIESRDRGFDRVFCFGVTTTGVFCRPGCAAKTPHRKNILFFPDPTAALAEGYRPCLRCRPLAAPDETPEFAAAAVRLSDAHLDRRLGAPDLAAIGLDPARVSRWFKRRIDLTFQGYHRARRMGVALANLRAGEKTSVVPYQAGYASESGFRDAFADVFGAPPAAAAKAAPPLAARRLSPPLGDMLLLVDDAGVRLLEFVDRRGLPTEIEDLRRRLKAVVVPLRHPTADLVERQLAEYFAGRRRAFTAPLAPVGTPFEREVWDELQRIPCGKTRSYAEQAAAIGRPKAVRAVGRANGRNRIAVLIPCHRVLGKNGAMVGYAGGIWRKERLLALER